MKAHFVLCSLALIVLGGCGGGGGGGGGSANAMGASVLPGATVSVTKGGPITAGSNETFTISVTAFGGLTVTNVSAQIATGYPWMGSSGTAASAAGSGTYTVSLAVPSPLPAGDHLWVQVTLSDGSVLESGLDDFPIS